MNGLARIIKLNRGREKFIKKFMKHIMQPEYVQRLSDADEKDEVKGELYCVEIYDVLDNKCFNKVINRLHALKKKPSTYKVDVYYRKSFVKKLQYVRVQIGSRSMGVVGDIYFNKEKYIRNIRILMTQINNNELVLCYAVYLKKVLKNYVDIHDCIMDNIVTIKEYRKLTWYISDRLFEANNNIGDVGQIIGLEFEWLRDWFQGTIEQLLTSSDIAKMYRLPILFNYNLPEKTQSCLSSLKEPFLIECFSDVGKNQFLHIDTLNKGEGCLINRYSFGGSLTGSHLLEYFSKFGNEFYYYMFYNIETSEIERRLGRYFTSLKRNVSMKDHKWLINKIRAIKERIVPIDVIEEIDVWVKHVDGKEAEEKFINYPTYQNKFLKIYKQYFEYTNSLNIMNYNSTVLWIALSTFFAAVIGIILTVWFNID